MGEDGEWRASPSYDLTFSEGYRGEHFTSIDGEGKAPDRGHFSRLAELIQLPPRELEKIEEEVPGAVGRWPALAREHGISTPTIERVEAYHARAAQTIDAGPRYTQPR